MHLPVRFAALAALPLLFASCFAYHHGSTGGGDATPGYRASGMAYGASSSTRILAFGGLKKDALVVDAKRNLLANTSLSGNQMLGNYTVDFKESYYFFLVHKTKVTVSAEVLDNQASPGALAASIAAGYPGKAAFMPGQNVTYRPGKGGSFDATVLRIEGDKAVVQYVDAKGNVRIKTESFSNLYKKEK